jgi:hypothetical protein
MFLRNVITCILNYAELLSNIPCSCKCIDYSGNCTQQMLLPAIGEETFREILHYCIIIIIIIIII